MASDQFCLFQLICLCQDERTDYARRLHDWRFFGPGGSIRQLHHCFIIFYNMLVDKMNDQPVVFLMPAAIA